MDNRIERWEDALRRANNRNVCLEHQNKKLKLEKRGVQSCRHCHTSNEAAAMVANCECKRKLLMCHECVDYFEERNNGNASCPDCGVTDQILIVYEQD